jgi:hypothetical protein
MAELSLEMETPAMREAGSVELSQAAEVLIASVVRGVRLEMKGGWTAKVFASQTRKKFSMTRSLPQQGKRSTPSVFPSVDVPCQGTHFVQPNQTEFQLKTNMHQQHSALNGQLVSFWAK